MLRVSYLRECRSGVKSKLYEVKVQECKLGDTSKLYERVVRPTLMRERVSSPVNPSPSP